MALLEATRRHRYLKKINTNTAAIFFEPIQGEGGINVCPKLSKTN